MGERFQKLIKGLGFKSNVAFADKIKSSEGKVRDIIKGRVKTLSPEILEFLISKKVDLNWLFTGVEGEGEMFLSDAGNANKPDVSFDKRGNPIVKYPTAEINPILGELTADEIVLIQSHRKMKAEMEKKSKKSS